MTKSTSALSALGWNDRWSALAAELPGAVAGRVTRRDRGFAIVSTGEAQIALPLPERWAHLVTGDWVGLEGETIAGVLPRKGTLRRRGNDGSEQVLAANVDVILLVCGIDRPVKAGRIQRGAVQAWDAGASPIVVLNKADLAHGGEARLAVEQENPGLDVIETSTVTGAGLDRLRDAIGGSTAVLLGESGAGKSSLLNALAGEELASQGAVRRSDSKGRHTTTSRELHVIPGTGVVIDSPGIRALGLAAAQQSVAAAFEDIDELAEECRFSDCRHESEPGCAVIEAVESGRISARRLEAFHRLQREVASEKLRANPHERRRYERRFGKVVKEAVRMKARDDY